MNFASAFVRFFGGGGTSSAVVVTCPGWVPAGSSSSSPPQPAAKARSTPNVASRTPEAKWPLPAIAGTTNRANTRFMTRTRPGRSPLFVLAFVLLSALVVLAVGAASAPSKSKRGVDAKIVRKTLTITGNKRANKIQLRLRRRARNTLEIDTGGSSRAEFRFDRRRFKRIVVRGRGGSDRVTIDERRGAFTTTERTTVFGDTGNDRFAGGRGRETFNGGAGKDSANGGRGADVLRLGGGDDNVRSDASGGADRADGAAGNDSLMVVGTAGPDSIALGANAGRLRVANRGSVDAVGFENVDVRPLAGTDSATVGDLSGTGVARTTLGLA